jgi:hypothetical protein
MGAALVGSPGAAIEQEDSSCGGASHSIREACHIAK